MAREYIIVNDTPSCRPCFLTTHEGQWVVTADESEARHFDKRSEAKWVLHLRGSNRQGWRIVQAPFF